MKKIAIVAAVLAAALLSACNPLAKFQQPQVQLSNLAVLQRQGFEQLFLLKLKVTNPNKMALPIAGLQYQVRLNGFDVFSGNATDIPQLKAYSDTYIELPVSANLISAGAVLASLLVSEHPTINYQLNATFDLTGVLPDFRVNEKGLVNLER
ncbi:MAG TPA: LEA type 2 family protein [Cellvibrionaceae bacterium]|nr:LEA type 2 family protein [Cellvibrionaceae bacterium]